MSKHAITIPDDVARLFQAVPLRTIAVAVISALVGAAGAAVAIPRYHAATASTSSKTVSAPVVQVQTPQPLAPLPSEPLPLAAIATLVGDGSDATPVEERTDATPVGDRAVSDSVPSTPVKVERRASKEKVSEKVSEERVVPKWNGDWQAATARLGSNRGEASTVTGAKVAPATTANAVADASSGSTSDATAPAPVTISGCLEMSVDQQTFRLADTEGANVPKARNWRSGFLKKQAAPVDLLDLTDRATVRKYVGQRVTATGVVENREMRVRSLQASGNSCD